jgi:ATP-dependent Lhr-like helicase
LVIAPTGSGKTLAAFLSAIDRLMTLPIPTDPAARCRVVYVSPLKALAADVERNLRAPLVGISNQLAAAGKRVPGIRVGLRTGDTPTTDRRAFGKKPPDILITTPESLFLVLTSGARDGLAGVDTVILDEVHALAGTKRGAHLALSLERLDTLLPAQAQRIALSATVRPASEVARFVGGAAGPGRRAVRVVEPPSAKALDVSVKLPVEDLTDLSSAMPVFDAGYGPLGALSLDDAAPRLPATSISPAAASPGDGLDLPGDPAGLIRGGSIWPHVHQAVVDHILAHDSTLIFANSRRSAERLAARINEEYARRTTGQLPDPAASQVSAMTSGGSTAAVVDNQIAMAHHGSMSRERRSQIENDLKAGRLPAVVATSSLELGIDMGAIDLVIQISTAPSVAAGLQRIGRAGHHVGAVSRGLIYPVFRGDLVPATVTAGRMKSGEIEAIHIPANPLDVLAQQIVALVAMDDWTAVGLADLVRQAAPYQNLGDRSFEAVLDMLSGKYPSADFGELRPRLVWDRQTDQLSARPGAAYLARVSGGTIPDRGVYGVYLAGEQADPKSAKRVGDLDEEMVYESRVGDTFTLGSSTWRINQITPNAVYVTPAPGLPGRFPFWHGDGPGRPTELGAAIGQFIREISGLTDQDAIENLRQRGLDQWAATNLMAYLTEQRQATGVLPDDRTIVIERFPDELGDTRIMIHSIWGAPVNGAWASVIAARLADRFGLDAQVMHADDGIMLRLPETAQDAALDLVLEPDSVAPSVTAAVSGTGRFSARFREAAARALVLPRRAPGKRQPLWQQRHRAQQLLQVAAQFSDFPLVMEALRETLQEDFDVPGLTELMRQVERREVRIVDVATASASPFAGTVTFGYTAQFLYDGDAPLAERRTAALSLDPTMLAELLGTGPASDLAELLDPAVVLAVDAELARIVPERQAASAEALADLLGELGPASADQLDRSTSGPWRDWAAGLVAARRLIEVRIGGQTRWAVIQDAAALRDGLGVALPTGLSEAYLEPAKDPLGALTRRYIRHHGPVTALDVAGEFGLGVAVAQRELDLLVKRDLARRGRLRPSEAGGLGGPDYCDPDVLTRLRRRSLAALRRQVEPVEGAALGAFAPIWQRFGKLRGADGVLAAVTGLAGAALPASAIESIVLPSRVTGYTPGDLDELITAGEVAWAGDGKLSPSDGTVRLFSLASDDVVLAEALTPPDGSLAAQLLDSLRAGGAFLPFELAGRLDAPLTSDQLRDAIWELVWGGWVTADSFGPVRAFLNGGKTVHRVTRRPPRVRFQTPGRSGWQVGSGQLAWPGQLAGPGSIPGADHGPGGLGADQPAGPGSALGSGPGSAPGSGPGSGYASGGLRATRREPVGSRPQRLPPEIAARWGLAPTPAAHLEPVPVERRLVSTVSALLERYGLVTRGSAAQETTFAQIYPLLSAMEEAGNIRRGYFVEHLGGSQFALPGAPDQLRAAAAWQGVVVLAAADPANPYGAALPWPDHSGAHRARRTPGSVVVLVDGRLVFYLERGGKTGLTFENDSGLLDRAAGALAEAVDRGLLGTLKLATLDGEDALLAQSRLAGPAQALVKAGFAVTPQGLAKRAKA